jgi:hypothetical protein
MKKEEEEKEEEEEDRSISGKRREFKSFWDFFFKMFWFFFEIFRRKLGILIQDFYFTV